jgi:hypothetical protein
MNLRTWILRISVTAFHLVVASAVLASAPPANADEPEITYQWPTEGMVISEPPLALQLCFENPVDVRDLPPLDEGDFEFSLRRPDNITLGMRIVFQPDGYGVVIQPGTAEPVPPDGEWTWDFRVVDRESGDPLEETVVFRVDSTSEEPIIPRDPPACLPEGATQAPTSVPVPSGEETATTPAGGDNGGDDDDDTDVLTLVLITAGIAGIAALVGVVAFFFRRRGRGSGSFTPPSSGEPPPQA